MLRFGKRNADGRLSFDTMEEAETLPKDKNNSHRKFELPEAAFAVIKNMSPLFTCQMIDSGNLHESDGKDELDHKLKTNKATGQALFISNSARITPKTAPTEEWIPLHTGSVPGVKLPVTFCYHKNVAKILEGHDTVPRLVREGQRVFVSEIYILPRGTLARTEGLKSVAPVCARCQLELPYDEYTHRTRAECVRAIAERSVEIAGEHRRMVNQQVRKQEEEKKSTIEKEAEAEAASSSCATKN